MVRNSQNRPDMARFELYLCVTNLLLNGSHNLRIALIRQVVFNRGTPQLNYEVCSQGKSAQSGYSTHPN